MMADLNEKMQPTIKPQYRNWQYEPNHQYSLGQCPECGTMGDQVGEWSNGEGRDSEEFICPACNLNYTYETTLAYRFLEIEGCE
jgi:hypothetical protein